MYDKRLNDQLLRINERYQELLHSDAFETNNKNKRYLKSLKKLNFLEIWKDLQYRKYAKQHFSQRGNVIIQNTKYQEIESKKIAVYTCITGNYDKLIEPVYVEPNVDYYVFTDQMISTDSAWKKVDIVGDSFFQGLSPMMANRKLKILQNDMLMQYDYTVYIDGNIEIVAAVSPIIECMGKTKMAVHYHRSRDCIFDEVISVKHLKKISGEDMDAQLECYRSEGFPEHFGLYENSILVRNNKDSSIKSLMNSWWSEMIKYPTRDQLSLPYVIWKFQFDKELIYILGNDIERNATFNRIGEHRKK